MMSECMVPNWKQRHQRQEQVVEGGEGNRSSDVHTQIQHHHNPNTVPMPNYEVTELTWKNGQLAMHGLSGLPTGPTKQTWSQATDTLESIVHQATWPNQIPNPPLTQHGQNPVNTRSNAGSSIDKRAETLGSGFKKKRVRSETDQCGGNLGSSSIQEERSGCGSASAVYCKENDTTMVTWASFESPSPSLKTKTTYEDSACDHDGSENLEDRERGTKGEKDRSYSRRRSRAADVHNQSERKRRDRINEKMKALQKLVPNASKTDKASMLDEVIHYLKQLQAQVQLMSSARNMPQMMMPTVLGLHQQQQIQMSLLARMGMGMGMGVGLGMGMGLHAPDLPPTSTPTFVPPPHPFVMPPMIPNHNQSQATTDAAVGNSLHFNNPYGTFLGQPINMDVYNKMAAIYQQQVNQITQQTSSHLPSATVQGG